METFPLNLAPMATETIPVGYRIKCRRRGIAEQEWWQVVEVTYDTVTGRRCDPPDCPWWQANRDVEELQLRRWNVTASSKRRRKR